MKQKSSSKRGEGYIDIAVTILVVAFLLVFFINAASLIALNQNVKTIADHLTDYASLHGTTDIGDYAAELYEQTGIDFSCDFSESRTLDAQGRVQLGEPVVCTVTVRTSFLGFGDFVFPITVRATSRGMSQVYWK